MQPLGPDLCWFERLLGALLCTLCPWICYMYERWSMLGCQWPTCFVDVAFWYGATPAHHTCLTGFRQRSLLYNLMQLHQPSPRCCLPYGRGVPPPHPLRSLEASRPCTWKQANALLGGVVPNQAHVQPPCAPFVAVVVVVVVHPNPQPPPSSSPPRAAPNRGTDRPTSDARFPFLSLLHPALSVSFPASCCRQRLPWVYSQGTKRIAECPASR